MALREILADFGFDVDIKKLDQADEGMARLIKGAGMLGKALGVAAALFPIARIAQWGLATADAIDRQDKFAQAVGASTREVAQWESILADSGATVEQTRLGIRTFEKQVTAAGQGSAEAAKSMRLLGVRSKDAQGNLRPLADRLEDAVVGLAGVENSARRAAIAEQLFGESGLAFIRAGQGGAEAIARLRAEFDELNPDYEATVESARRTAAAMDGFRKASDALKGRIAAALLPALERVVSFVTRTIDGISRLVAGTKILEVGLIALASVLTVLAGVLLAPFLPAIAVILAVAAAIAAVVLVVEDLYQMFTGGESVIAQALDDLFGVGTARAVVETVTAAAEDLWEWLTRVGEVAVDLFRTMRPVLEALAKIHFLILRVAVEQVVGAVRVLIGIGRALAEIYEDVVDGVSELFLGLRDTALIVSDAIEGAYDFLVNGIAEGFEWLSERVTGSAEGLQKVWERVTDAIKDAIDQVLGPAREALDVARGIGDYLFGDDSSAEAGPMTTEVVGAGASAFEQLRGAARALDQGQSPFTPTPRVGTGGGGFTSIFNPTINVSTQASDPAEVARVVERTIEEREQRVLRDLREDLVGF